MACRTSPRCLKLANSHVRRYANSQGPPCLTVEKLLSSSPTKGNVTVNGFIRSIRNQKSRSFAVIGDGTSLEPLQALLTPDQAQSLSTGCAVSLTGEWTTSPNTKAQAHELHVKELKVIGSADPATYPLQKKYQSPEYLRTIPHLRARIPFNALMLRFRGQCITKLTEFFARNDFTQTHPPLITSSDCEGAGEVFQVENAGLTRAGKGTAQAHDIDNIDSIFFRSPKYLTVSSQLHLEALAHSVGKVWTLSPTFRAEKSDTSRHLSEFYMLEAEVCFIDQLSSVMDLIEEMLRDLTRSLYDGKVAKDLIYGRRTSENWSEAQQTAMSTELERRWQGIMSSPWPRLPYADALEILEKSGKRFEHPPNWEIGLQAEHERFIATTVGKGQPVFITKYPQKLKPFYMLPSASSTDLGPTVECFDLVVPEVCEIAGGSMREYRLPQLLNTMQSHGLVPPSAVEKLGEYPSDEELGTLKWYVDLRRWGSVPHGGFGLGFDRLLGYLAGVQNIREVVAFPRWVGRCDC